MMRIPLMIAASLVLVGCPKKKEAPQPTYEAPEIEWPEDDDLDDLPEAGEEDTGEIL